MTSVVYEAVNPGITRWVRMMRGRQTNLRLVTAAHLPHYTSTDAIIGTVIFVTLLVIFAVAVLRRG